MPEPIAMALQKYQLKKSILKFFSTTKQNAKNDPGRRAKNLLHLTFEDERTETVEKLERSFPNKTR